MARSALGRSRSRTRLGLLLAVLTAAILALNGSPASATPASATSVSGTSVSGTSAPPLYAWGGNPYGELGDGTLTPISTSPLKVALPAGVSALQVAAGAVHSLAAGSDGRLYAWGDNTYGQVGDGTTIQRRAPVVIALPGGVSPIAVAAEERDSYALGSDLKVYGWGYNADGEVGDGTTTQRLAPALVRGLPPVLSISGGQYHAIAVGTNGRLYAWGFNQYGQLGDGTTISRSSAVAAALPPGTVVTGAAAGGLHSIVALSDHKLYTWGYNQWGELGDGTTATRPVPAPIALPGGAWPITLGAGYGFNIVLASDGRTYGWGYNAYGQVGDGTTIDRYTPVRVGLPSGVLPIVITGGEGHALIVAADGSVWAWGYNGYGQLADGTLTDRATPARVTLPGSGRAWRVGAGLYHSLASALP